ncbi:MAG: hypothetical protein R3211_08110, partial [Balneolaceae bacterium]|nr:hypothetical protein [Balneolaceae bacterium]
MKYLTRPGGLLAATLILLVITFLIIEGIWYSIKPLESQKAVLLEKSLKYAEATFNRAEQQLQGNTRELATRLQQLLQNRGSKTDIQALFTPYDRLWGITLFKNNTPLVWKGYGFNRYPPGVDSTDLDTGTPITDVRKQDNVLYLLCYSIFEQAEGDSTATYSLFTSDRIEQRNALPIGRTSEYHLLERAQNSFSHPVSLSFFNPLPAVPLEYRTLYTSAGDSVGVAYAISGDFSEAQQQWKSNLLIWRWTFLVAAGLIILGFIYFWLGRKRSWSALFLQIAVFATAWAGLHIASVNFPIESWLASLTTTGSTAATQPLITFMLDGLFMFLLAVTLGWQLSKRTLSIRSSWYPATMFNALL